MAKRSKGKSTFFSDGDPTLRRALPVLLICAVALPLLALVYLYAHFRAYEASFLLIDGVFQTLSPLRRLMAGEIFFRDFVTYLGIGHTMVYLPLFVLLGQTVYASMFSAHFVCCLATGLSLLLLFWCVTRSWRWSLLLAAFFVAHALFNPTLRLVLLSPNFLDPGVSGRPLRIFLPTLQVLLLMWIWPHYAGAGRRMATRRALFLAVFGAAALFYSNDYGLPSLVILPFCFLVLRPGNPYRGWECLVYALAAPVAIFMLGDLLTFGHLADWFRYNFLWVAKAQFWYFEDYTMKMVKFDDWVRLANQWDGYKWQLPFLFPWLYWAYRRAGSPLSAPAVLLFLLLIHFVSGVLVQFGSWRDAGYEMGLSMVFPFAQLYCFYVMGCFVPWKKLLDPKQIREWTKVFKRAAVLREPLFTAGALLLGVYVCSQYFLFESLGEAVAAGTELSDQVPLLGRALDDPRTEDFEVLSKVGAKLTDAPVLAEYGGFDMVVWGRRSDSRADLLIHAFGPERDAVATKIRTHVPQVISTIAPSYNNWQQWSLRANWWFYRPLYENYEVVANSAGYWIWAPRTTPLPEPGPSPTCEWRVDETKRVHFTVTPSVRGPRGTTLADIAVNVRVDPLPFWESKIQREFLLLDFIELPVAKRWTKLGARIGKPAQSGEIHFPLEVPAKRSTHFELSLEGSFARGFSVESCRAENIVETSRVNPPKAPWWHARFN